MDVIEQTRRLDRILSPVAFAAREAKRQRDNLEGTPLLDCRGLFAHYTSAEAALKIIETRRMWMRSSTCMADYREVQHGYEVLHHYFDDATRKAAFLKAMDDVHPGAASEAIKLFDNWWAHVRYQVFINSLSDHHVMENNIGRLSMWRAFGNKGTRVALIFSAPWYGEGLEHLGLQFSPVTYISGGDGVRLFDDVVANVVAQKEYLRTLPARDFHDAIFHMVLNSISCAKHVGFWEEREWRGVYTPAFKLPTLLERSIQSIGGVPQPVYSIPLDGAAYPQLAGLDLTKLLDRVIVGPTEYAGVVYEAFVDALTRLGIPNAHDRVVASQIPIRTS